MLGAWTLLAEEAAAKPQGPNDLLVMLLIFGTFFIFFIFMPARRERKQKAEMLASIGKGARIVTAGGIVGVVTAIESEKGEEDCLLLKIDDNANIKLRVLRSSVGRVIPEKKDSKDGA